ncbi:MAG: carboxylating nicotinate-nucleotide diphosphorylase [bacterium]|nr:carboxylating nicotinate-nucleotide diphosphorylase [bacterium]
MINKETLQQLVLLAIEEDIKNGDITSEAIFFDETIRSNARIISKEEGIFCGSEVLQTVYTHIDPAVDITMLVHDGDSITKGTETVRLTGPTVSILAGERIALNFIQRMSGIATKTSRLVSLVKGTGIEILDTRKTLPGFRMLDKYSVFTGGGTNHRIGLFDMVMIKDNHIKAAGSITEAVRLVREKNGNRFKIEVETTNLDEVREAADLAVDIIMLDNMDKETMKQAITLVESRAKIEVSGNMDENKIRSIRDLNIDYVSIGALTHSVAAFDLSMKFN